MPSQGLPVHEDGGVTGPGALGGADGLECSMAVGGVAACPLTLLDDGDVLKGVHDKASLRECAPTGAGCEGTTGRATAAGVAARP